MNARTIALLHPGEMGAAIGAGLRAQGHRVLWASAGRGAATRQRAADAGLEDAATLARAVGKVLEAAGAAAAIASPKRIANCSRFTA